MKEWNFFFKEKKINFWGFKGFDLFNIYLGLIWSFEWLIVGKFNYQLRLHREKIAGGGLRFLAFFIFEKKF